MDKTKRMMKQLSKRWQNRKPNANWHLSKDHPHNKTGRDIGFTDDLKERSKTMEERFNEPISPEKVRIQTDLMEAIKISSEEERLRRLAEAKKGKEEETLQLVCVDWFDELTEGRIVRLHVSNQSSVQGSMRANRMGYWKGFPDLLILKPKNEIKLSGDEHGMFREQYVCVPKYYGLLIEFKTEKGRLDSNQINTHEILTNEGYLVKVVRSYEQFKEVVNDYFREA